MKNSNDIINESIQSWNIINESIATNIAIALGITYLVSSGLNNLINDIKSKKIKCKRQCKKEGSLGFWSHRECVAKCLMQNRIEELKLAKLALSKCDKSKNPEKCKIKLKDTIRDLEIRIQWYKEKLKSPTKLHKY